VKVFKYVLIGVLFYVGFLVAQFPAERAYAVFRAQNPQLPLRLSGIEGAVWSGEVDALHVRGHRLERVAWNMHWLPVLLGRLEVDWRFRVQGGHGTGVAGLFPTGGYYLKDVQAQIPAPVIARWTQSEALRPEGDLTLRFDKLEVSDHVLQELDGALVWSNARVDILQVLTLGDLKTELSTGAEGIKAVLSDSGGPLLAEGVGLLKPDGSYEFNGAFAARDAQDSPLARALSTMGRADAEGKFRIARNGRLEALGIRF
jgi:hypothetical protein